MRKFNDSNNGRYLIKVGLLFTLIVLGKSCETVEQVRMQTVANKPILLLISIDGFRNDYQEMANTPVLDSLSLAGAKATALIPVFPSKTFPNHYSQVTGLYPENHGIISNRMYDPQFDQYFTIGSESTSANDGKWYQGEPVWVTAGKQALITATMFWPGSEAEINGTRPDYFFAYNSEVPEENRIQQVLEWINLKDIPPRLITLYFERIDHTGHLFGPSSRELLDAVEAIDSQLSNLMEAIATLGLSDRLNLIIVSDHGMTELSREKVIFLDDYISLEGIEVVNWSPVLELIPKSGQQQQVYEKLSTAHQKLSVYQKGSFPESWHLNKHPRLTPIMALAESGWSISSRIYFKEHPQAYRGGAHGYHPSDPAMHGIFIACGPAFKAGNEIGPVESVHLYELLCNVLGIIPAANDGRLDVWTDVLAEF